MRGQSLSECCIIWAIVLLLAFGVTKTVGNHIHRTMHKAAERIR
jgi:hypothetical protein